MEVCAALYKKAERDSSATNSLSLSLQIGTTKGTGGDVVILEEAAYVEEGFFYETVAPLLLVGVTSLICISTLTSEVFLHLAVAVVVVGVLCVPYK